MIKATDIRVLNEDFELVSIIDVYESFIWTDRYNECGDFELYTKLDPAVYDAVKIDYYLEIPESDRLMIVESVVLEDDYENGKVLKIVGRSLESILDRRVIWDPIILENVGFGSLMKTILYACFINPTEQSRKVNNFIFDEPVDAAIENIEIESIQLFGENLYDVVTGLCKNYRIGFKIILTDDNKIKFSLYKGADRTYDQDDNEVVIFSNDMDNLLSSNFVQSNASFKTACLVLGEGDGSDKTKVEVNRNGEFSGLTRREMSISESIATDGTTITNENYPLQLYQKGTEALSENDADTSFDGEIDPTRLYSYEKDYFLGDLVQTVNSFGLETVSRVVEYIRSYASSGITFYPTFEHDSTEQNTTYNVISYNVINARKAVEDAERAYQAANSAQDDADRAQAAADAAQSSANTAQNAAEAAQADATRANNAANAAQTQAGNALTQAQNAQASATHANASANGALSSLAVVEKVLDTLNWITEHGTYTLTTDTQIVEGKVYFVNTGTAQSPVYTPVAEPKEEELSMYYELDIDEAMSDFVASHLTLTDDGLYVLKDSNSYKVLVANDGVKIYDSRGTLIATYGANIEFSEDVRQYIGGENAYIVFDPVTGSITIGGTRVNFGSKTLSQVIASIENSITSVAVEYAIGDDSTTAPTTGWSTGTPTWTAGKYIWQRTATTKNGTTTYSNVACIQGAKGETGAAGATGPRGPQGETGEQGPKGDPGASITISSITYAVSTTETKPADSAFTYTSVPTVAEGNWLWTRVLYSDSSKVYTKSKQGKSGTNGTNGVSPTVSKSGDTVTITDADGHTVTVSDGQDGAPGSKGDPGTSITITNIRYAVSTTESQPADSSFTYTTVPTVAEGNWLWTRVLYSDNSKSYSKSKQGKSGTNGTSVTVTSTKYAYQLSTSGTTVPTGTWQNTPQAPTSTQYAWTRTITTFSDGHTATTYTVGGKTGTNGTNGTNGTDGVSVTKITMYYILGTTQPSKPSTKPPTGWSDTQPNLDLDKTCYVVILTEYDNNTYLYSDVSILSEYTASKEAIETANTAQGTANAIESTVNGTTYYQYTTGGTTYNVLYDEDNDRYYYFDDNEQEVTVTYAQLDKDEDDVPITVTSGGIQLQVNDNTDALGELRDSTATSIDSLSTQISNVESGLGSDISELGDQVTTLSDTTTNSITALEERTSANTTAIGNQGDRLSTAEGELSNLHNIIVDKYEAFIDVQPSVPSITLGKRSDSAVRTRLEITDEAVNFYTDGKNSAKASGKSFESPEGKFEQITMKTVSGVGDLRWIARSNGHLSLKKITGDN